MTFNRKDVRSAWATLISSGVSSAQSVYGYQRGDLQGETPVVVMYSAGIDRSPLTPQGSQAPYHLNTDIYVLYNDPDSDYGEDDAEDMLDDIESQIATVVEDNRANTPTWGHLSYSGESVVVKVQLGGDTYLWESIPLIFRVYA